MKILLGITFILLLTLDNASGEDYAVLISGGPTPHESQVSIETNAIWISGMIDQSCYQEVDVLFASGQDRLQDVRYQVDPAHLSPTHQALVRIFGDFKPEFSRYRQNRLTNGILKADRQNVQNCLATKIESLSPADNLWVVYSGHGGWKDGGSNNTLRLWNEEKLSAVEFIDMLFKAVPGANILFVLPQCHSGGFADAFIERFIDNNRQGVTLPQVCGFTSVASNDISEG